MGEVLHITASNIHPHVTGHPRDWTDHRYFAFVAISILYECIYIILLLSFKLAIYKTLEPLSLQNTDALYPNIKINFL